MNIPLAHNTQKEMKPCSKCGVEKPNSFHYFYKDHKTNMMRDYCKECSVRRGGKRNELTDVLNRYEINDETKCWEYTGYVAKSGYGLFYYQSTSLVAHRVSYQLAYGTIQDGLVIDHLCKNKKCINPEHLEAVEQKENINRWFAGIQHCKTCSCKDGD